MQRSILKRTAGTYGLLILLTLPTFLAQPRIAAGESKWWPEVRKIDEQLRKQRWKISLRKLAKLEETVLDESWYGPDLHRVLAELALFQAIAGANLRHDRQAVWYWHIATNLDSRVRDRDLAPYGRAGKLLYEFPLRARGKVPVGFENRESPPGHPFKPPILPDVPMPTILFNSAAVRERAGDFRVEVIVDKEGRLHHPVVLSTYLHPVLNYAALRWLGDLPPAEPRRIDGEPTDSLYEVTIVFRDGKFL
ncbi:MAG: hypothetical protein GY856_09255 [bacterium]|nr:hypothetical protein [bacterium]